MPSMMRAVGVSKMTRELDAMTNCSFAFVPHRFLIAAAKWNLATSRHGILMLLDVNPNSCPVTILQIKYSQACKMGVELNVNWVARKV